MSETILVVEGEEKLRKLYQNTLKGSGYDVITAPTGKRALDALKNEVVDLVILDLALPDGSGFDYLEKFVKTNRKMKFVINTDNPNYKRDFHSWVADAFLMKSSDMSELKNTIDLVLHTN